MAKAAAKKKPLTKTEIFNNLAERTGLNKKQIAEFFDALAAEIEANIGKKGPRVFQIPNLCKIVAVDKPALPKAASAQSSHGRHDLGRSQASFGASQSAPTEESSRTWPNSVHAELSTIIAIRRSLRDA